MMIEKHIAAFNNDERTIHYRHVNSLSYVVAIRQRATPRGWGQPTIDVQYMSDLGINEVEDLRAVLADAASIAERWTESEEGQPES